jgi:regulatory protein
MNQSGFYTLENAKQKAYRYLALRPRSEKEVAKKLKEKGFPANIIQETLEKLRDLKYINDNSFSSQWARHLAVNKLWGNRKIIADLQEKGINKEAIEEAVKTARLELSEEDAIALLIKKKTTKHKSDKTDTEEKRKIFQHLLGRGFPPGLILQKLGKMSEDNIHGNEGQ